jgi:hypothetical protein
MQPAGHHTRNSDGRRTRDRLRPHSRGLRCALLILGLAALIGGRPQDMPAIMHALARGPKRELPLGAGDRRGR